MTGRGGTLTIELPWPAKELSPNARVHPIALRRMQVAANDDAFWLTRAAMGAIRPGFVKIDHDGKSDIILKQTAYPPDNRQRDRDNLDSSLKGQRDGIARALGVNDRFLRPTGIEWGEVCRGGKIVIEVAA